MFAKPIIFPALISLSFLSQGALAATCENSVADHFSQQSFSLNDGSENWQTSWLEIGESDGAEDGKVLINDWNCTAGKCLRLGEPYGSGHGDDDDDHDHGHGHGHGHGGSSSGWSNRGVQRELDLQGASAALLTFDYYTGYASGSNTVTLQISADGGANWATLRSYSVSNTNYSRTAQSFNIVSYAAGHTRIRFLTTGSGRNGFYVDNLEISYTKTCGVTPSVSACQAVAVFDKVELKDKAIIHEWNGNAIVSTNSTSNNKIKLKDNAKLYPDVLIGAGGQTGNVIDTDDQAIIYGSQGVQSSNFSLPASLEPPAHGASVGNLTYDDRSLTLSTDLVTEGFRLKGNTVLTISGDVTLVVNKRLTLEDNARIVLSAGASLKIYADDKVELKDNAIMNGNGDPAKVQLVLTDPGDDDVKLRGNARLYAQVFTTRGKFEAKDNSIAYGSFQGKEFKLKDNAHFYADANACGTVVEPPTAIAEWRFDEASWDGTQGEVVDQLNAHAGVAVDGADTDAAGLICRAASFDGVNDLVDAMVNPKENAYTVSFWFKTSQANAGLYSVRTGLRGGSHDRNIRLINGNVCGRVWHDETVCSSGVSYADNQWHQVAHVLDGVHQLVYVDGVEQARGNKGASDFNWDERIHFGYGFSDTYGGLIDEALLFDEPLSGSQIASIYSNQKAGQNYDGSARTCPVSAHLPIADWDFDETRWNGSDEEVVDQSAHVHHGTAKFGADTTDGQPAVAGNPGTCGYGIFDGQNDYVRVPWSAELSPDNFTVAFWARVDGGRNSWRTPITNRGEGGGKRYGYNVYAGTNNRWQFWTGGNNVLTWDVLTGPAVTEGVWTHVAISYERTSTVNTELLRGTKKLYINGALVASKANAYYSPMRFAKQNPLTIGSGGNGGFHYHFNGAVDQLKIYDAVLDQGQIDALRADTQPCAAASLTPVADWRFDESSWNGSADEVHDSSGNGHHGVARNVTTSADAKLCRSANLTPTGTADYLSLANTAANGLGDYSLTAWVKTSSIYNRGLLSGANATTDNEFLFYYYGSSNLWPWVDGSSPGFISAGTVADNRWHQVAWTRHADTHCYYLDGVLRGCKTGGSSADVQVDVGGLLLGQEQDRLAGGFVASQAWDGLVDELKLFDEALSANEIQTIYANENAGQNYDGSARTCPSNGPDHFVITHDGSGIHCAPEPITLAAYQSDGGVAADYRGTITLNTQTGKGSWSLLSGAGQFNDGTANDGVATYTFAAADNGTAQFSLYYPEGVASFDVDAYAGSVRDDDSEGNIHFAPSGFTVTGHALSNPPPATINDPIADQTAGQSFNLYIAAYGSDPTSGVCGIIETYQGSKSLGLTTTHVDPANGSIAASGGGSVNFVNGQAILGVKYKDAGRIRLTVNDGSISGGSNSFVVKPASFDIALSGNNQTAADVNGSVYTSAGSDFTVTVSAQDAEGDVTPNFGLEAAPESITLSHVLAAPLGGATGSLTGTLSRSGGGIFSGVYQFSEVGIINLAAAVSDGDYLGAGNISGSLNNVGRFTPNSFVLSNLEHGSLANVCSSGGFTYLGDSFGYASTPSFEVIAHNVGGAVTTNYTGAFARLSGSSASVPPVTTDSTQRGADGVSLLPLVQVQAGKSHSDLGAGVHRINLGADTFRYTRNSNAMIGRFTADLALRIASITDGDGVSTSFSSNNVLSPVGNSQRYGRLSIGNAFGSELNSLSLPAVFEEYDPSVQGFVVHADDSCSVLPSYTVSDLNPGDTLNALSLTHSMSPLNAGHFEVTLAAPGEGQRGTALVTLDAPAYLEYNRGASSDPDPSATASFGVHAGSGHIIYQREIR